MCRQKYKYNFTALEYDCPAEMLHSTLYPSAPAKPKAVHKTSQCYSTSTHLPPQGASLGKMQVLQWHKSRKEWSAPTPGAIRMRGWFSSWTGAESPAQGDEGREGDTRFLGDISLPWAQFITGHASLWAGGATGTLEQLASTSTWEAATPCRPVTLGKITHQSLMKSHRRHSYYVGVDAKEQLSRGLWFIFNFVKYICLPYDPLILPLPAHVNRETVNGTFRSQQSHSTELLQTTVFVVVVSQTHLISWRHLPFPHTPGQAK